MCDLGPAAKFYPTVGAGGGGAQQVLEAFLV